LTYACSDWDPGTSTCLGDNFNYSYDGAGNLLAFSRWDEAGAQVETVNFVYNGANQIACLDRGGNGVCWDPDDVAYSYDAYGNLTGDGIKAYAYDAENRLISVSDGASTTNYTYSGDGDRVSQRVDGVTTSYVIDIATPLTMVLAEITGSETIYYLHGLELVAQNDGISTEYFGYDGLGSVRQVLESSASVMFAQVFDPYGDPYASAGTASTSWGFTGEQTDTSGLIFLRARYYDPRLGRFVQLDPSRRELNPYQYGLSNPILHADPSGLFSQITNFTLSQFEAMSVDERISWIQDFMALEPQLNNWYNNIEDILNYFKVSRIFGLLNKGGSNSPDKWISWADAGVLQVIQDGYRDYRNRPRYLTPIQIGEDAVELWSLFFDEVIRKNRSDDGVIPFWANAEQQGVEYGRAVADQKVPKSNMHPADVMIIDGFYYLSTTYRYIGKVPNGGDISGSIVFAYVGGKLFGYKGSLLFGCIGALLGDWYVDPRSRVEGWNLGPTGEFAKRMEDLLIAYNELRHPDWSP
jgi:RHS repeat-associated protein